MDYGSDAADQLTTLGGLFNRYDADGRLLITGTDVDNAAYESTALYDDAGQLFRTGQCRGDINDDGVVAQSETQAVFSRFKANATEGDDNYDAMYDLNGDGIITSTDSQIASRDFTHQHCKNTGLDTGNGRYYYNRDGLRVRARTFPAGVRQDDDFTWDQGASLPQVLQDTKTQNGASSTTTYVYGLSGPIAETDGAGNTSYYLQDGLGSTMQLTDTSGNVTDSYTYDAFGAMTSHTGTNPQPFGYAGQQQDVGAEAGLVYLRARHMDPALGRFVTQDRLPFRSAMRMRG